VAGLAELGDMARLRLLEALVLAAGAGDSPPPLGPLERVSAELAAGRAPGTVNVGGALLRGRGGAVLEVGPEPLRRGAPARPPVDWARAGELLADPVLAALRT
jgi:hypothetical protein